MFIEVTLEKLVFSQLNKNNFKYGVGDTIIPLCSCRAQVETTEHLLLCCHFYSSQRSELLISLRKLTQLF